MKVTTAIDGEGRRRIAFRCNGCGHHHGVPVSGDTAWEWNGDVDNPTISPSILNRGPYPEGERVCHIFVREGKIEYLQDCTHHLAGQTVEMEDVNEH